MSVQKKNLGFVVVSEMYTADLKGKQSVRTTFKLPPRSIDALSLLAAQLGIKQKSIFDHLVDDTHTLQALASEFDPEDPNLTENRVAKTFVVSRRTLENLEQVSKRFQTPRDALVEFSIERIMPLLQDEKQKHQSRKKLQDRLEGLVQESRSLLEEADKLLDRDDPVFEQVFTMCNAIEAGREDIEQTIDKGRRLEDF